MEDNERRQNNNINKFELLKFINKKTGSLIDEEDPSFKLINNYSEINAFLNKISDKFKFLYFHRKKIKKILYDCEEEVFIDSDKTEKTLDKIFYLSLLVTENKEEINYKYSINYIKQLDESNNNNNLKLSKIIFSKIILDLIEYFEGFDEYNENTKSSIDDIKNKNIDIIKKNNSILKEFNLNDKDFISKSIEEIYFDIIKTLLLKYKDYKKISDIINELELDKIDLTNFIFKEILIILSNDKRIKEKSIENINDVFNEDKIEFYYLLLKNILKNSYYINKIPFLIETRKIIVKNKKFIKNSGNINKAKLEYLIETLTGSKYYFKQFEILHNDNKYVDMKQNNKEFLNKKLEEELKMNEKFLNSNNNSIEKFLNENDNQQQNLNSSTKYVSSKKFEEQHKNIIKESKLEDNDEKTNNISQYNSNRDINVENNKPRKTDYNGNKKYGIVQYIEKISDILEGISINYLYNGNKTVTTVPVSDKMIVYEDLIDLKNYKYFFDMDKEQFKKYASFLKLINFIQKIEELFLKENKKNIWNISIKLEHDKLYEKQNKNGIYNITCKYGFFTQEIKLNLNYKDENILLNGFNQGFLALLCEINELL